MNTLINLIEVIVWPATLLIILFGFRRQFKSAFSRITDVQASATGVSLSFSEKLEATKQLASNLAKSMTMNDAKQAVSKSSPSIQATAKNSNLIKVKELEGVVKSHLLGLSEQANIDIENKSIPSLNEHLKEKGIIKFNKSKLISSFLDLSTSATDSITDDQLEGIQEISKIITTT